MSYQINEPNSSDRDVPKYSVLAAAFPDGYARDALYGQARSACATYGLEGEPFPLERYHMSLCCFWKGRNVSKQLIEWAREECARVAAGTPAFQTTLDQRMSFSPHAKRKPLVMCASERNRSLNELLRDLYGLPAKEELSANPHVTLLYDQRLVVKRPVDPVSWTIHEIVLLISHVGQSYYEPVESFPLCG